jgi:hypothetical protein
MPDLAEGAVFAGHRIDGVAGRGGMGTVYRATHLALDHQVALKVIAGDLAGDSSFRERFKSESRIAVSLRHPNVVPIHHAGEEEGLLFVTMDLIEGPDLRKLLVASGPLEPDHALAILVQVASALDVAHSRGLVHRDIKPGNVLIEERGGSEHAYLTDFGLTKRMDQASEAGGLTSTGAFVGTLDYVAPEQIRGDRLDARTDVYALGGVLFEMLTGRPPFGDREEKVAKMYAHLQDEPQPLGGNDPVSLALDAVIARAMAKDPDDRFPSAGDLARAAAAAAGGAPAEAERSVATGPAAPTQAFDAVGAAAAAGEPTAEADAAPPEPTVESGSPEEPTVASGGRDDAAATAAAGTEPGRSVERPAGTEDAPQPPAPPSRHRATRGRLRVVGALVGVAAVAAVAALILSSGGDSGPGGAGAAGGGGNGSGGGGDGAAVGTVVNTVRVEGFPVGVDFGGGAARVVTRGDGMLFTIEPGSDSPASTGLGVGSAEDVVVADGQIWVTAPKSARVVRLPVSGEGDPVSIEVGSAPRGIAAAGDAVWVANSESQSISRIPFGAAADGPIPVDGTQPHGIAVDGDRIWVTSRSDDRLIRVSTGDTAIGSQQVIDVGRNPKGVAVSNGIVWVANTDSGTVSRIDADTGDRAGDPVGVGGEPRSVVAAFDRIWVSNGNGYVTAIDPGGAKLGRVEVDGSPEELAAGGGRIWVTTGVDDEVVEIEPTSLGS